MSECVCVCEREKRESERDMCMRASEHARGLHVFSLRLHNSWRYSRERAEAMERASERERARERERKRKREMPACVAGA